MGLLGTAGLLHYRWPLPLPLGPLERHLLVSSVAAVALGLALGAWGFFSLRRSGTAVDPAEPTRRLVVRGPYRFTRNPLYLAQLLVMLGFAVLTRSGWFLGAVPFLAVLLHHLVIIPEERYLSRLFGDAYAAYCRKTRRWV
jgi:protein-S-isoprenylcysteine O-methyltransferase Ste14